MTFYSWGMKMDYRKRHLEHKILEASKYHKVILVLGARQVGKSTILKHLFPNIKMIVFDPTQDLYDARKDPDLFLDSFPPPLILDEVQFVPELLSALKRRVDLSAVKGQYFLTGSQNFSVMRNVAESMAGRVAILNLENLTLQEMLGLEDNAVWLPRYLVDPAKFFFQGSSIKPPFSLVEFLWRGMFPGTLGFPNEQFPLFFQSYVQTYVERDVRNMENIQQFAEFDRFLGIIASLTAQEINPTHLGREIGISPSTARRWLDVLLHSYQWNELLPYHGNVLKRLTGKKKGMMKDTGLTCYLQRIPSPEALAMSPKLGGIFETWVVNYIQEQCAMLATPPMLYHWRTGNGAEVDLVLQWDDKLYPIEVKCKSNVGKADLSGMRAFRETYEGQQVMSGLVIYAGTECYKIDQDTVALPWTFMSSKSP